MPTLTGAIPQPTPTCTAESFLISVPRGFPNAALAPHPTLSCVLKDWVGRWWGPTNHPHHRKSFPLKGVGTRKGMNIPLGKGVDSLWEGHLSMMTFLILSAIIKSLPVLQRQSLGPSSPPSTALKNSPPLSADLKGDPGHFFLGCLQKRRPDMNKSCGLF